MDAIEKDPLIEKAIRVVGRQSDLAMRTGCAQQTISKVLRREIRCSGELALAIHHATGGEVGAHELRPDLWTGPEAVPAPASAQQEGAPA